MRIFNTIIHQLVQVMINMVSDEGAAKHTARRAACRQGRGLPDLCEVDWPILLCRSSGSIAGLIELNSDNSHPVAPYRVLSSGENTRNDPALCFRKEGEPSCVVNACCLRLRQGKPWLASLGSPSSRVLRKGFD